jgi:hypothetical protein
LSNRRGNLRRREHGGRDLIEQGLEDVMVPAVNQKHFGVGPPESARRGDAAEAAAQYDHPFRGHA